MKLLVMIALACLLTGCGASFRSADLAPDVAPKPKIVDVALPETCPEVTPAPPKVTDMGPAEAERAWKFDRAVAIKCRARLVAYAEAARDQNRRLRGDIDR